MAIPTRDLPAYDALYMSKELLHQYAGLKDDEHGLETPKRFLQMLGELTTCKDDDAMHMVECIKWKAFSNTEAIDEMVIQKDIPFVSLCNHHVLPFKGVTHVAYIPDQHIVGISKLSRIVQHYARRLQLQERMTAQIADFLEDRLDPVGVAVAVEAEHLCTTIRGVRADGTMTTTQDMRGVFKDHNKTAKAEFLQMIGAK